MEQFTCRTCLSITDKKKCTEISQICCIQKTIKDVIIFLVPEMASTLLDNECICKNCLRTLRSCIRFIERCLQVEMKNAETQKALEHSEDIDWSENDEKNIDIDENVVLLVNEFDQIDLDHNYYVKIEPEDCDDINYENTVEADTNLPENSATRTLLSFDLSVPENVELNSADDHYASHENLFCESMPADDEEKLDYVDNINLDDCVLPQITATSSYQVDYVDKINLDDCILPQNTATSSFQSENSQLDSAKCDKYTCHTCSEQFSCSADYELHLQIHPAFMCHQCGKCIKTEFSYKRHVRMHAGDGLKLCDFCGKRFVSMTALKLHVSSVHKQESPFMCDKCPKKFKNKIKLGSHIRMVHEKARQQQCQECGKFFQNREACLSHYRLIHLQLKPFVCDVCGKEFGRNDYLRNHMYVHTGQPKPKKNNLPGRVPRNGFRLKNPGQPVSCKICGKMIASVHVLKAHLQSHVVIKRHKCKYCKLSFTLANNRDRHQRLHEADPENKFRCDICWKRMKTEEELAIHVLGHYKERPPNHTCDICGEKFHRKYLMHNHQLEMHTDPGDIEKAEKEIVLKNLLEYAHPSSFNIEHCIIPGGL